MTVVRLSAATRMAGSVFRPPWTISTM